MQQPERLNYELPSRSHSFILVDDDDNGDDVMVLSEQQASPCTPESDVIHIDDDDEGSKSYCPVIVNVFSRGGQR